MTPLSAMAHVGHGPVWFGRCGSGGVVRAAGVEPALPKGNRILSPVRLPFRHARAPLIGQNDSRDSGRLVCRFEHDAQDDAVKGDCQGRGATRERPLADATPGSQIDHAAEDRGAPIERSSQARMRSATSRQRGSNIMA